MPEGGTLAVTVRSEELPAVSRYMLPAGNYVEIVFVDSGCGIRSENLHKVFDPYFTTKDGGTGLGLSTTFSVINNHGGHIEITSEIGQGTTVKIILPTSAENPVDAE
jgi:signal transduction histidine kinase